MLFTYIYRYVEKIMIHSIPNPKMTSEEVKRFRADFIRHISGKLEPDERRLVEDRKRRIKEVTQRITRNNGGKNPIFGN